MSSHRPRAIFDRRRVVERPIPESVRVAVRLATRQPFAGDELVAFVGAHAVPGIEHWDGETLRRSLSLPFGHGVVALTPAVDHVDAIFRLVDWRDLAPAVERVRRWLDLDADPEAIDDDLHNDPVLAPLVDATPGMRSPGSIDPYETAIRTIVGQQVSVAGARTVTGRIVAAHGMPLQIEDAWLDRVFPSAVQLAGADPALLPLPEIRRGGATFPLGYSPTGEVFNLTLEDVATATAIALEYNKLIFLMDTDGAREKQ